jgi:hypothetical protein
MNCKNLLIIEQLSFMSLIYALLFRMLGFKSIFLKISRRLKNEKFLNLLSGIDISIVDYSSFKYYDWSKLVSLSAQLSKNVYSKMFDNNELKKYEAFFQEVEDIDKKLKVVIINILIGMFGGLAEVLICAEYYKKKFKLIRIYTKSNGFVRIALGDEEYQHIKNISQSAFFYLPIIFTLTRRAASLAIKYLLRLFKRSYLYDNKNMLNEQKQNFSKYEVLYFPHQGVAYGDLFLKDQFYMSDPSCPFHRRNILHIEYQKLADEETNKNIVSFYEENNVPYCYTPGFNLYGLKNRLFRNLSCLLNRNIFRRNGSFLKVILVLYVYNQYNGYFRFLSKFKNAKIALVGYDILFPKVLSMALSAKGITTIATQERLVPGYYNNFNVMLDYYFVINESIKDRLYSSEASYVKTVVPIGPIRSDLLNGFKKKSYDSKIVDKKKYKLVIAYDFHSVKDCFEDNSSQAINWENNLLFYNDLIKLCKDFPDIYIVIRGKNDIWCSLPAFSEVYEDIMKIPNIEINRDYSEMDISYKLASQADLIIAKPTSIGDEALACGIPVLFHDYSQNMKQMVSSVFNYDNYPVFVYSYSDLKSRMQGIINGTDHLNSDLLEKMKRDFFTIPQNGTIKQRLHTQLTKIYMNKVKEDKNWLR